jgi:hypothetical protein
MAAIALAVVTLRAEGNPAIGGETLLPGNHTSVEETLRVYVRGQIEPRRPGAGIGLCFGLPSYSTTVTPGLRTEATVRNGGLPDPNE